MPAPLPVPVVVVPRGEKAARCDADADAGRENGVETGGVATAPCGCFPGVGVAILKVGRAVSQTQLRGECGRASLCGRLLRRLEN